ncbi:Bacterial dipeptidyl-peptidase SH3 domain-containing protein [Novosphingobium lubricantis]
MTHHALPDGAEAANRPAFVFRGQPELTVDASPLPVGVPPGPLALVRPADRSDKPHLPVRGDLAHIGLAGRYFVPHYAVPMPHRATRDASLRSAGKADGEELRPLASGEVFDVLDISGGWAWGQAQSDLLVGYVDLAALEAVA